MPRPAGRRAPLDSRLAPSGSTSSRSEGNGAVGEETRSWVELADSFRAAEFDSAALLSAKLDRVEVGVLSTKRQPDRPPDQGAEVVPSFHATTRSISSPMIGIDSARARPATARPARSWISRRTLPAAEVEQVDHEPPPENLSGRVSISPPA